MYSKSHSKCIFSSESALIPFSEGPSHPAAIEQTGMKPSYIDMVAVTVEKDGAESIRLSILNRHPTADWDGVFKFEGLGKYLSSFL